MFLTLYLSQASSAIFETRTKEKIRHFDEEEEEDIWEDKEINYATRKQVKARSRFITHIMMPLHLLLTLTQTTPLNLTLTESHLYADTKS